MLSPSPQPPPQHAGQASSPPAVVMPACCPPSAAAAAAAAPPPLPPARALAFRRPTADAATQSSRPPPPASLAARPARPPLSPTATTTTTTALTTALTTTTPAAATAATTLNPTSSPPPPDGPPHLPSSPAAQLTPTTTTTTTTTAAAAAATADTARSPLAGSRMPSTAAGSRRTTHTSRATAANARSQPSSTTAPPSSSSSSSSSALAIAPRTKNKAKNKDCADHDAPDGSVPKKPRPPRPAPKVLPRRYDKADPRDLVVLIASMLMELIGFNDDIPLRDGRLTRFHSRSPPRISVRDYLARLTTHATLSPPILLSMVYYIDLLCELYPSFTVSSLTVHRFLITAATVASKGLSDSFWTNKTYSRVGGISVPELALLELEFLWRVEWRIVPQPEKLVEYYQNLVERCADYVMEPEPALTDPEPDPRPYQHARPHGGSVG